MTDNKIKINPKDKRLARIIAIQAIYASEIYPENSDDMFDIILNSGEEEEWLPLESTPTKDAINYGKELHKIVMSNKDELDDLIIKFKKNMKETNFVDISLPTGVKNLSKFIKYLF